MLANGLHTARLKTASCGAGVDQGNDTSDLDVVTILDKFVKEHPDFSLNGAKGCLSLTGYEGILGYRTHTDKNDTSEEAARRRAQEIEAVKPIIQKLKETGWTFGCHSWGHINLSSASTEKIKADTERFNEVGSSSAPRKSTYWRAGPTLATSSNRALLYLQSVGFSLLLVGIDSFSQDRHLRRLRPHAPGS